MTKQEMIGVLRDYIYRLRSDGGNISPKVLREELRRTRDDIHSLREDILSSHYIKNKSYENNFNKTYTRGRK